MFVEFVGEGSFSIERFEQIASSVEAWPVSGQETGQSRIIYNFRAGQLMIDSRRMDEISQCLIETPFGRITLIDALVLLEIYFDQRNQFFNFSFSCSQGRMQFNDKNGVGYTLQNGQRLVGVGAQMRPSFEMTKLTNQDRARIVDFLKTVERNAEVANDPLAYRQYLQWIRGSASPVTERRPEIVPDSGRRPIFIERANESQAVTPFRGEMAPPSAYQADHFRM